MKKELRIKIILISISLILTTCTKEIVEVEKEPQTVEDVGIKLLMEPTVKTLNAEVVKETIPLDTVVKDGQSFPVYQMELEGSSEDIQNIEVGNIIYVPIGDKGGMVLLLLDVINGANNRTANTKGIVNLTIKVIQTTLDMYFKGENNVLKFALPENRSKKNTTIENKLIDATPVPLDDITIEFKAESEDLIVDISTSADKMFSTKIIGKLWSNEKSFVSVNGSIIVNPSFDFLLEYEPILVTKDSEKSKKVIEWLEAAVVPDKVMSLYKEKDFQLGNIKQLKANLYSDIDTELAFQIHIEKEIEEIYKKNLASFTIPTVPVSSQFDLSFEIDFKALGIIDFELNTKTTNDVVVGVHLDRNIPDPIWYAEYTNDDKSSFVLKGKIELITGIKLVLESETYVLGALGPEISVGPFIESSAKIYAIAETNEPELGWNLSVDAGVKGEASLNLSAFHIDPATWRIWKKQIAEVRKNIYDAPNYIKVESGNGQIGMMGEPLPLPIELRAYDSRDKLITWLPVPIHLEVLNGSSEPDKHSWTNEGILNINWTLGKGVETQTMNAYLKDEDNKKSEITISASAIVEGEKIKYDTLIDNRDEQVYKTITIGNQVWMAENLAYEVAGKEITDLYEWNGNSSYDGWCYYENDKNNYGSKYGILYQWKLANEACPSGWHLPSDNEWTELVDYLADNGYNYDGSIGGGMEKIGKPLASKSDWYRSLHYGDVGNDQSSNNSSGFTGKPGGHRTGGGTFSGETVAASWWSSTEYFLTKAFFRHLNASRADMQRGYNESDGKRKGLSVRCVKD